MASDTPITLRPATPGDSEALLAWRNDPDTRRMSRSTAPVSPAEHGAWYAAALADPGRLLWVGESAGRSAGVVGFRLQQAARWEVSITVAPTSRGVGVGARLLAAGMARLAAERPGSVVTAAVRAENPASRRLFEASGFRLVGEADGFRHYERPAGG